MTILSTGETGWLSPALASPELRWRVTPALTLEAVNRSCWEWSAEQLVAQGWASFRDLLAGQQPERLQDAIQRVVQCGAPVPVLETCAQHPVSGDTLHFLTSLTPLFEGNRLWAVEGSSRDVTLLRQVELARERRLSELVAVSYMAAQVSTARTTYQLLKRVLQTAVDVVGGAFGALLLVTPRRRWRVGVPNVATARPLLQWVAQAAGTLDDCEAIRVTPCPPQLVSAFHGCALMSLAVVPVRLGGRRVGLLAVGATARTTQRLLQESKALLFAARQVEFALRPDAHPTRRTGDQILRAWSQTFSRGKLTILSDEALQAARDALLHDSLAASPLVSITSSQVLPRIRRLVEDVAAQARCRPDQVADLTLCATEAATNVLVHGSSGTLSVHWRSGGIDIWIRDVGRGIDLLSLVRAALLRSYSSSTSMGLGLGLMLELADQVSVHSSQQGTTLIVAVRLADDASTRLAS